VGFAVAKRIERDRLLAQGLKHCPCCKETKPLSAFSKRKGVPTGRQEWCRACVSAWGQVHREENMARCRKYRERNPDEHTAYNRQYYLEHRETENARGRKYGKTDKGRAAKRRGGQRRRARAVDLFATLTEDQWQAILGFFGNRCAYCGVADVPLAQEHVVPLSAGGGYEVANIVPACGRCNSSKKNMSLEEWAGGRGAALVRADVLEAIQAYIASG